MFLKQHILFNEFSDGSGVVLFNPTNGAVIGIRYSIEQLVPQNKDVPESLINDLIKQGFLQAVKVS
ncbi:hypothetical protein DS2_04675 [Catenovulum agarivorans DS-2]|uniref:Uncharacterized protein n=1 Tax=Catenovulum agarivorans DS-2 TaxID=1328313 RepID=W7QQ70_9ALTE|nr:hypothetical protein [Catenovulum agarivorans]EWH11122.1 hypothetical protein DS2_04675 [Catenovulum agarivorans DS-2]